MIKLQQIVQGIPVELDMRVNLAAQLNVCAANVDNTKSWFYKRLNCRRV